MFKMFNRRIILLTIFLSFSKASSGVDLPFTLLDDQPAVIKTPAVLNFWATWCAPCIKELPDLEELGQKLGSDATVYLVNFGEETKKILAFKERKSELFGSNTIVVKDSKMAGLRAYQLKGVPTTVLLDSNGDVVETIQGLKAWGSNEVVTEIRAKLIK